MKDETVRPPMPVVVVVVVPVGRVVARAIVASSVPPEIAKAALDVKVIWPETGIVGMHQRQ